jgi:hypothetical protein
VGILGNTRQHPRRSAEAERPVFWEYEASSSSLVGFFYRVVEKVALFVVFFVLGQFE